SGSPLVNESGEVIGVTFAYYLFRDDLTRRTFHIHLDELEKFLADTPGEPLLYPRPAHPGDWPSSSRGSYQLTFLLPTGDTHAVEFFHGPNRTGKKTGLWLDLYQSNPAVSEADLNDLRKDPVRPGKWSYQFALQYRPRPTAFYDTTGKGKIDL